MDDHQLKALVGGQQFTQNSLQGARTGLCVPSLSHQGGFPGAVALWRGTQPWPTLLPTSLSPQPQSLPQETGSAGWEKGSRLER